MKAFDKKSTTVKAKARTETRTVAKKTPTAKTRSKKSSCLSEIANVTLLLTK
jgi:hypothetical protein